MSAIWLSPQIKNAREGERSNRAVKCEKKTYSAERGGGGAAPFFLLLCVRPSERRGRCARDVFELRRGRSGALWSRSGTFKSNTTLPHAKSVRKISLFRPAAQAHAMLDFGSTEETGSTYIVSDVQAAWYVEQARVSGYMRALHMMFFVNSSVFSMHSPGRTRDRSRRDAQGRM